MARRLFWVVFQLIALAWVIFILTAAWIILDGMTDLGERADVAVVPGHAELVNGAPGPILQGRLDRAIQLYNEGEFKSIVVSGATRFNGYDEAASMETYLAAHEVPAGAIIEDHEGANTEKTARALGALVKEGKFVSVMVVTDYYHITRLKLALRHEGITEIEQAHSGSLQKQDALPIAREVVAFYAYLGKFYLLPAFEKAKEELKIGGKKAEGDVEKAKETVDKKIDSMAK